ncbi:hypothetical protein [Candidatus Mycoplasma mahonii]|uniref:hypothetical protein n=1 Tax=Candidatus Mycoplasma mahonii TaxID=3004105 RepID=UPI0026ECE36D|nr:hypothetical protein [Candidatus Mycoplasma mahonii]WKX02417.1 hypothetical protein O3I44_03430 [Candidatus Mycoplasma mahonii]
MKINKKKSVIGLGASIVMVAPIGLVIACSNGGDNWNYDSKKAIFDSKTGKEFSNDINNYGEKDDVSMTILQKRIARFMYNKEQIASKDVQRDEFNWSKHEIYKDVIKDLNTVTYFRDGDSSKNIVGLGNELPRDFDFQEALRTNSEKPLEDAYKEWSKKINDYVIKNENKDKILDLAKEHDNNDKSFKNNYDNLKKIDDNLALLNDDTVPYDVSDFSSRFSRLLQPVTNIKKRQTKIFQDTKNGVVSAGSTKAEGEEKWVKDRLGKYGGATSDDEAIEYLVLQQIKSKALLSRNISVIKSYTREQLLWSNTDEGFSFLKEIGEFGAIENNQKNTTTDLIDNTKKKMTDKIWYYGTHSNINHKKVLKDNFNTWNTSSVIGQKFKLIRHALIIAKPDDNGETLPWVVDENVIKNMFSFKPVMPGANIQEHAFEDIQHLFENIEIDGETANKNDVNYTKDFIEGYSDNGGTRSNMGSLGILHNGAISNNMNNGFSLGMLAADSTTSTTTGRDSNLVNQDDDIYKKIQIAIKKAYIKTMVEPDISDVDLNLITINSSINDEIVSIREFTQKYKKILGNPSLKANMIKTFGRFISEALGAGDGRKLVYTNGNKINGKQRYLVTSKNGIHFVASYDFDQTGQQNIGTIVKSEVKKMAQKKSNSAAQYGLDKYFTNMLTENGFYYDLLKGESNIDTEFKKEFSKYLTTLNKKDDLNDETPEEYIEGLINQLERVIASKAGTIANVYAENNTKWLVGQYDTGMIESSSINPDEIYQDAFDIVGGEI